MATINGRACVVDGVPVDKVYSNGKQVYGRNLLTGTSNELKMVTASNWGNSPTYKLSGEYGAGKYYASAYVENTTPVLITLYVSVYVGGKFIHNLSGKAIPAGQSGAISFTFDIFDGQSFSSAFVGFTSSQTESYTYKYKEMMVTRTPSPWSPAPEDGGGNEKDKIIAQLREEAKHEFTDTNAGSSQDHSIYATDTDDPAK